IAITTPIAARRVPTPATASAKRFLSGRRLRRAIPPAQATAVTAMNGRRLAVDAAAFTGSNAHPNRSKDAHAHARVASTAATWRGRMRIVRPLWWEDMRMASQFRNSLGMYSVCCRDYRPQPVLVSPLSKGGEAKREQASAGRTVVTGGVESAAARPFGCCGRPDH